jgi:hypothetical protein
MNNNLFVDVCTGFIAGLITSYVGGKFLEKSY